MLLRVLEELSRTHFLEDGVNRAFSKPAREPALSFRGLSGVVTWQRFSPPFFLAPGFHTTPGAAIIYQDIIMPNNLSRPCKYPGCPNLTNHKIGYCAEHLKKYRQDQDRNRKTSTARGYNRRWMIIKTMYLREHPFCVKCQAEGKMELAQVVDHIIPHHGDYDLFWDQSNWQSLCAYHHNVKTATNDGGFGNIERRARPGRGGN